MENLRKWKLKLKYLLPTPLKKKLKYSYYALQDCHDWLRRKKRENIPPRRFNFVGSSDFEKVGREFFQYFVEKIKIQPNDHILDIGCGIGRMAIPLTKFLKKDGKYFGFDIDQNGIEWCQKNITTKYPNFTFQHVNIYNPYYNKKGTIQAKNFRFPCENEIFDFVFATSVFTHMPQNQVMQYLQEIHRVLKNEGIFLVTFFDINNEAAENIKKGLSNCQFHFTRDNTEFSSHKDIKEAEIGYKEEWILNALKKTRLDKKLKIYYGSWSGRKKDYLSYQDIFIGKKFLN